MTEPLLLEVTRLVKHFPVRGHLFERRAGQVRAVDGVDFTVRPASVLAAPGHAVACHLYEAAAE